jgi:hypothetical protein
MDQMELYKGFRIRAYQEWSGLWLAETKKSVRRRRVLAITTTPMLSTLLLTAVFGTDLPIPNVRSSGR